MKSETVTSLVPIVDDQTKILILGSMPGVESLQRAQYYTNSRNQFWKIIVKLFNDKEPNSYTERIALLQDNHIGSGM